MKNANCVRVSFTLVCASRRAHYARTYAHFRALSSHFFSSSPSFPGHEDAALPEERSAARFMAIWVGYVYAKDSRRFLKEELVQRRRHVQFNLLLSCRVQNFFMQGKISIDRLKYYDYKIVSISDELEPFVGNAAVETWRF